jgi:hypothetical protein
MPAFQSCIKNYTLKQADYMDNSFKDKLPGLNWAKSPLIVEIGIISPFL